MNGGTGKRACGREKKSNHVLHGSGLRKRAPANETCMLARLLPRHDTAVVEATELNWCKGRSLVASMRPWYRKDNLTLETSFQLKQ